MRFMKELCQRYGFHPDACAFLDDAYKKLEAAPESLRVFEEQVEAYRQDHLFAHMPALERLHSLAREVGLHQDTLDLLYMIRLLPILQEIGCATVAITGKPKSTLARETMHHFFFPEFEEACYMHLAPTSSTTALLV